MKIYFHASIFGKQFYSENYSKIIQICRKEGHQVSAGYVSQRTHRDTDKFTAEQHQKDYQRIVSQIKKSDVVIIESSYPSLGTGHYLTIALQQLKPVLVLYQDDPHGVLVGDPNRLLVLKKYSPDNENKLRKDIKDFLKISPRKKLKNRFNLMLDDEMLEKLEECARREKISKAEVIRNLLSQKFH